jgi:hypothetical protein
MITDRKCIGINYYSLHADDICLIRATYAIVVSVCALKRATCTESATCQLEPSAAEQFCLDLAGQVC